jgi:diaminohydroxyphosphoribosylaminopyrimidine deaminase/5-amino-6-(5-phosphoribosylamino)uracil reductase
MPEDYMARALALAAEVRGHTSPNPPVGAVIVTGDGTIVGEGATQSVGGPHAEIMALRTAGEQARGAIMYVTLEPHCFHGHTPPCTEAIIAAGIREVHIATIDRNPRVNGQGIAALEAAGIHVIVGEHEVEARELVENHHKWITTGLPFSIAKFAMSLDGKIATRTGESRWISSELARNFSHGLRQWCDAILVGVKTVIADNPLLTTRLSDLPSDRLHHPLRVILDSTCRIPMEARLLDPSTPGHTLIATTEAAPVERRAMLVDRGAEVLVLPARDGRVDLHALWAVLGQRAVTSLLIEGGSEVLGAVFSAGLVDKVFVFIAPCVIGGAAAPGPVGGIGVAELVQAPRFRFARIEPIGPDALLVAYPAADEENVPA